MFECGDLVRADNLGKTGRVTWVSAWADDPTVGIRWFDGSHCGLRAKHVTWKFLRHLTPAEIVEATLAGEI